MEPLNQPPLSPGFYEYGSLPQADLSQMDEFTTGSWAELSILFVGEPGKKLKYPHIADGFVGYLPYWETPEEGSSPVFHGGIDHSPLEKIEEALGGRTHENHRPLRHLSHAVGIIANQKNKHIHLWQREEVLEAFERLKRERESLQLKSPEENWRQGDFKEYYDRIRELEAEDLQDKVRKLGRLVIVQNDIEQLYVSSPNRDKWGQYRGEGGRLAPLVGLSINSGETNDYRKQVHGVVPVILQKNGTIAIMGGAATGSLYTAYAPKKGLETKNRLPRI